MNRKQFTITGAVVRLMDKHERVDAIQAFKDHNGQPPLAQTIRRELIHPLEAWAEAEYQKHGAHTGVEESLELTRMARDFAERWDQSMTVLSEQIETFEKKWISLAETIGFAANDLWEKENQRSRRRRTNAGEAKTGKIKPITKTIKAMLLDMEPTADNIWAELVADAEHEYEDTALSELRATGKASIIVQHAEGDSITYDEVDGKKGNKIKKKRVANLISSQK